MHDEERSLIATLRIREEKEGSRAELAKHTYKISDISVLHLPGLSFITSKLLPKIHISPFVFVSFRSLHLANFLPDRRLWSGLTSIKTFSFDNFVLNKRPYGNFGHSCRWIFVRTSKYKKHVSNWDREARAEPPAWRLALGAWRYCNTASSFSGAEIREDSSLESTA